MRKSLTVDGTVERLKSTDFTDERAGRPNTKYTVNDALLAAFAIFYMQSGSFLAGQRHLQQVKGKSNAHNIFGMEHIPTDTHIRNLVDPVAPQELATEFRTLLSQMQASGHLQQMRVLDGRLLFSLDGVYYFSSQKISCPNCQTQRTNDGQTLYKHSAITPVVVAPQQRHVLAYVPEFVVPQDGHEKQDCERAATQRWLAREQAHLQRYRAVLMGDDLYSNQPLCTAIVAAGIDCIFVCHRQTHAAMYDIIDAVAALDRLPTLTRRHWNGKHGEQWHYRYLTDLPMRQGEDALRVNWCELTITHEQSGEVLYCNEWMTTLPVDEATVVEIVACGRARWKSENENNNVLKNHGYHLAHNFGHGDQHLASTLLSLNLLAFLLHTIAHLADETYQLLRQALGARRTFFEDIRALMRYLIFDSWQQMLAFMLVQLEVDT